MQRLARVFGLRLQAPTRSRLNFFTRSFSSDVRFAKSHEWLKLSQGGKATIGITDHAQKEMGDLVYVELPKVGSNFKAGDAFGTVESVKATSSVYAPVDLEVTEVNQAVSDKPQTVNESAERDGWLIKAKVADAAQANSLMNSDAYAKFLESGGH